MAKHKKSIIYPSSRRILETMGEQIKLARLRRKLSSEMVAERAGIARNTMISIERGGASVSLGNYFNVLKALGLEKDFLLLAKDDELGRKLQDAKLSTTARSPKLKP